MSEHSQTISNPSSGTERNPVDARRFDYERYRHHLDRLDMPEAARRRIGEAWWHFLRGHVDRAFGDDPVQLALRAGDRFRDAAKRDSCAVLSSDDNHDILTKAPARARSVEGDAKPE